MSRNSETVLENDVSTMQMMRTLQRVYAIGMLGITTAATEDQIRSLDQIQPSDGWAGVANAVMTIYLASGEADIAFTPQQLAEMLHRSYHRAASGDDPNRPFAALTSRERLSWELVARHSAWVSQAFEEDLRKLGETEVSWGNKLQQYARQRSWNLEPIHDLEVGAGHEQ